MTVSMQVSKRIYAGNGVTRQWDVDFPLASPQDVRVYITSPVGAEEELTADFEMNISGTELIYPTLSSGKPPLAEGWSLTLERQTPLTQEIDLLRQGELDAEVLESGYDKLTLLVQELNEKVSRSIKYPVSTMVEDLETDTFLKNILSIKQDAFNASASAVAAAQVAQASALSAQESAQNALADINSSKVAAQDELTAAGMNLEASLETYLSAAQEEAETARYYAQRSVGKTVGEVYFSQSAAESDNPGALPLFTGETIASADTLYPDFYAWLTTHTELTCAAEQYEAALTQFGECAHYVLSDTSIRLPLIKNYIKAANTADGIKNIEAGLPNITGYFKSGVADGSRGAFSVETRGDNGGYEDWNRASNVNFNASWCSAVYGKSTTVTPASTTLYPWVVAFQAAVPASTAQASAFQQALSGKADTNLGNIAANIDYIVDSYSDIYGNWWRKYKSGFIEQGGQYRLSTEQRQTWAKISFFKPFADIGYTIQVTPHSKYRNASQPIWMSMSSMGNKTTTNIDIGCYGISAEDKSNGFDWCAWGYAAQ